MRAGAGGDEAALFAAEVQRMIMRYAERMRFKTEILSTTEAALGGVKEVIFEVKGRGAIGALKYESGVHRVQRVPVTESTGRIHTSTATVAVLPEVEDVEIHIDPNEVRVDVYRSTGPGGQSVNTTDSAVQAHPHPHGAGGVVPGREVAAAEQGAGLPHPARPLYDMAQAEQDAEVAAQRRSQVGTGDRAQKIRTYNFPQGRVTDHRVGLTSHRLEAILQGELEEFTEALQAQRPGGAAGRGRRSDRRAGTVKARGPVDHRLTAGDGGRLPARARAPVSPAGRGAASGRDARAWSASISTPARPSADGR